MSEEVALEVQTGMYNVSDLWSQDTPLDCHVRVNLLGNFQFVFFFFYSFLLFWNLTLTHMCA